MIKISKEELINGEITKKDYWLTYAHISKKGTRFIACLKPTKVKIKIVNDCLVFYDNKREYRYGYGYQSYYSTRILNHVSMDLQYLFETEQEAIEYWNSCLRNQLDKVQSEYESKSEFLTKNIIL